MKIFEENIKENAFIFFFALLKAIIAVSLFLSIIKLFQE